MAPALHSAGSQRCLSEGKDKELLSFPETEGFPFPFGRETILENHCCLCVDIPRGWVATAPNGAACGAIAHDGLIESMEELKRIWEDFKAGKKSMNGSDRRAPLSRRRHRDLPQNPQQGKETLLSETYYLIRRRILAKREHGPSARGDYIFKDGRWVGDSACLIQAHLLGFDEYEPEGSPYRFGATWVLDEIEEISSEEAKFTMGKQTLAFLCETWKRDFADKKRVWDENPGWPAKLVETRCVLYGTAYTILPKDIGLTDSGLDQGFMESVQGRIEADLIAYGADPQTILSLGFLD